MDRIGAVFYDDFMTKFVPGRDPTDEESRSFSKFGDIKRSEFGNKETDIYVRLVSSLSHFLSYPFTFLMNHSMA